MALTAYAFYAYFKNQRAQNQASEFAALNQRRKARTEHVEGFTAEDTLRFQEQTDEILTGIQHQQAHFGALIQNFELELQSIQAVGENLDQTNMSLRDRIIGPFQSLLLKMQEQYQIISKQISVLSSALSTTNAAAAAREQELSQILESLKKIEPQLKSGLSAIGNIQSNLDRKTQRIKSLEKTNASLTESLTGLTQKTKKLAEIIASQKRLIELLNNDPENALPLQQQNRRATISPNYKYGKHTPNLFPTTTSALSNGFGNEHPPRKGKYYG